MYNLKRILQSIIDVQDSAELVREKAAEGLTEIAVLEKQETEAPQEMRDVFAAAALIGVAMANGPATTQECAYMVGQAWSISDLMMIERAKRVSDG